MFAVVLIALVFSLLVVIAVVAIVFVDVALAGPQPARESGLATQPWQPPCIHDAELLAWAAHIARVDVRRRLSLPRTATTANEIATEICAGAKLAIDSAPQKRERGSEHACSRCRHQMIVVTPPEALAIVASVRSKRPQEVSRIRRKAVANARLARHMNREEYEAAGIECPLLCDGNLCAANGTRPLHCRGWLPLPGAQGAATSSGNASQIDPHARTIVEGAEDGLEQELTAHGLDGNRYELNSALAMAFDTPRAAERWANSEPVFVGCKEC